MVFHTSAPSPANRELSAPSGAPFPSNQIITTVRSECRVLQKRDSFIGFPSEYAAAEELQRRGDIFIT